MKSRALVAAFVLPVAFTALVLASTFANRREGRGPTVLTARELALVERNDDQSIADVWLAWTEPAGLPGAWVTRESLAAVGFDVSVDPASSEAADFYRRQLLRRAFVAFELDGPAWQAVVALRQRNEPAVSQEDRDRLLSTASRLVPVAIGPDAATLVERYPDPRTHLIAAAIVGIMRTDSVGEPAYLAGTVMNVDPRRIQVPASLAGSLPQRRFEGELQPFSVSLMYGSRWEPWIVSVDRAGR
jgi:hypothetical protein